jgi:hypothetical protein
MALYNSYEILEKQIKNLTGLCCSIRKDSIVGNM